MTKKTKVYWGLVNSKGTLNEYEVHNTKKSAESDIRYYINNTVVKLTISWEQPKKFK